MPFSFSLVWLKRIKNWAFIPDECPFHKMMDNSNDITHHTLTRYTLPSDSLHIPPYFDSILLQCSLAIKFHSNSFQVNTKKIHDSNIHHENYQPISQSSIFSTLRLLYQPSIPISFMYPSHSLPKPPSHSLPKPPQFNQTEALARMKPNRIQITDAELITHSNRKRRKCKRSDL